MTNLRTLLPIVAAASVLCAGTAFSQNTENDWKWVVDHYKDFGQWTSACDHRDIGDGREERCYVRVVDVYSPRPDFGAAFVFASRSKDADDGIVFEFSFERGTVFAENGFAVKKDGETLFSYDAFKRCEEGSRCVISGEEGARLAGALSPDAVLFLAFSDRRGNDWTREWSGKGLSEALADLVVQSDRRNL